MKYLVFLSFAVSTTFLLHAEKNKNCSSPPTSCYADDCCRTYCLGPNNFGANPPTRPYTCNGDFTITAAVLYWQAHQDGMEYAVETHSIGSNEDLADLIDADYKNPHFDWNFGFKFGIGYNTTCDGWDFGILWTSYQGKAFSHIEEEADDNSTLLPIWTNFEENDAGDILFAREILNRWKANLNLIDIDLGRMYWNSHKFSLRPHIGLRIAFIDQKLLLVHQGGSFNDTVNGVNVENEVDIHTVFKGVGTRIGLDSVWNIYCGWSIYGDFAVSVISGRFHVDNNETNREVEAPFSKNKVMELQDAFRLGVLFADLGLGVQYHTLFNDCNYALTLSFGWEQHLFLNQNQMWRIILEQGSNTSDKNNIYDQRRGDLSTQGWTFQITFGF